MSPRNSGEVMEFREIHAELRNYYDLFLQICLFSRAPVKETLKFCWNFHVRPKVLHNFIGLHGIERKIFPKNNSVHAIHFFFFSCALGKETVDIKMFT